MSKRTPVIIIFALSVLIFLFQGCGGGGMGTGSRSSSVRVVEPAKPLYLTNNIHTQTQDNKTYRANYENWTSPGSGHVIFPVNTVVEIDYARRGFYIIEKSTGKKIDYEYNENGMGGRSAEQYVALITATEPVSLRTLSDIDRKGIADGKVYAGMSKDGVRIALGYPAVNRTPSLGSNTWVYAKNRWTSTAIMFDEKGRVKSIK